MKKKQDKNLRELNKEHKSARSPKTIFKKTAKSKSYRYLDGNRRSKCKLKMIFKVLDAKEVAQ